MTRRYLVGASSSVYLQHRLGIEVDALYRRLDYDWFNESSLSASDAGIVEDRVSASANRIDVPVLVKWSPEHSFFVVGGPAFAFHFGANERHRVTQLLALAGYSDKLTTSSDPLAEGVSKGVTFGSGFEARAGRFRITPEVRYSHWIAPAFDSYLYLAPVTNQVDILVGIEFRGLGR